MNIEDCRQIDFSDFWNRGVAGCCLETLALRDGPPMKKENYRVKIGVIGPHPASGVIKVSYSTMYFFNQRAREWVPAEEKTPLVVFEKAKQDFFLGPFELPQGDIIWAQGSEDPLFRRIYKATCGREPFQPIKEEEFYTFKDQLCSFAEIE